MESPIGLVEIQTGRCMIDLLSDHLAITMDEHCRGNRVRNGVQSRHDGGMAVPASFLCL